MSAYENYTAVSADYDRTRIPVGVEIILGCLASGGRSSRLAAPARRRMRDG